MLNRRLERRPPVGKKQLLLKKIPTGGRRSKACCLPHATIEFKEATIG